MQRNTEVSGRSRPLTLAYRFEQGTELATHKSKVILIPDLYIVDPAFSTH